MLCVTQENQWALQQYRAANELPEEYGEVLGGLEGLKELM